MSDPIFFLGHSLKLLVDDGSLERGGRWGFIKFTGTSIESDILIINVPCVGNKWDQRSSH